jgi:NAD(P)-dependent dehydrogenase (short-subunit alcohol dehydrogenase family)
MCMRGYAEVGAGHGSIERHRFRHCQTLGLQGYALTIASRRADKIAAAAERLREEGIDVAAVAANVAVEEDVVGVVDQHRGTHGRLDILVNNAGMGISGSIDGFRTEHMDLQYAVNLRSVALFYRESLDILRAAADESGTAIVVNVASITGKYGAEMLAVYSAVKHGVVGFTEAMNKELQGSRIKSCALCPGYVDTALSEYVKDRIPASEMLTSEDIAEAVRFLTRLSTFCVVPEILFERLGDRL